MIGLLAALSLSMSAAQSLPVDDCRDDRGIDRCEASQQARVRALFGLDPIEAHRDSGDQVRRVFYVDGYGRDVVAIAFVRRHGHDPEVRIHFRRDEGAPDLAPLVAPVPIEAWDLLIARSAHFDRVLVPLRERASSDEMVICMHSWVFTVEATDPARPGAERATLRRRTEDACSDGLTEAFAREMYRAALPLFPHCALLDSSNYRTPANQLAACSILAGDRMAAAMATNSGNALFEIARPEDAALIEPLFPYQSVIDWNGERIVNRRSADMARYWVAKALEAGHGSFYVDSMTGETANRVRMRGGFIRFVDVPGQDEQAIERASADLVWIRDGNAFAIESAAVGNWEPYRTD